MNSSTISPPAKTWLAVGSMFLLGIGLGAAGLLVLPLGKAPGLRTEQAADRSAEAKPAPSADSALVSQELRALRHEVEQLRTAAAVQAPSQLIPAQQRTATGSSSSPPATGRLTLNYWNGLNSIMSREAAMRSAPPQLTAGNASSFVSGRSGAFEYAAGAIGQLNSAGVDADVLALGSELTAWYQQGLANSRQAESLLTGGDISGSRGQTGQDWQTAEKRHRDQCLEINRRGERLQQELSRKYGLAFPKLE